VTSIALHRRLAAEAIGTGLLVMAVIGSGSACRPTMSGWSGLVQATRWPTSTLSTAASWFAQWRRTGPWPSTISRGSS